MDMFWCITLSFLVIRWFIKREERLHPKKVKQVKEEPINPIEKELADRRQAEYDELKKKGYDDELIAVILPTISNN